MLTTIYDWVQSYMGAYDTGSVNLWACDGIPGNCTLWPLDSKVLWTRRGLRGFTRTGYQSRYQLLYLSTTPHDSWVDSFAAWCQDQNALGEQSFRVWVERTDCKQNADGTFAITACITAEYETAHEGVEE